MEKALADAVVLSLIKGVGPVLYKALIERFHSATDVFQAPPTALQKVTGAAVAAAIKKPPAKEVAEKHLTLQKKKGITVIPYESPAYPSNLRALHDPPPLLYTKWREPLTNTKRCVAIVGTRSMTPYGQKVTERLVEGLAPYDVTIVSGLAYGVDACAHQAALQAGMATMGVLAGGLDRIYPAAHAALSVQLAESGGLISEQKANVTAERGHFPRRNRIIAALCEAVVVVEAGSKSGALITALYANDLGREVFAVPGPVEASSSLGCHRLLKEHYAHLLTCADDIGALLRWAPPTEKPAASPYKGLSPQEEKIVAALQSAGCPLLPETLATKVACSSHEVGGTLLELELRDILCRFPNGTYALARAR